MTTPVDGHDDSTQWTESIHGTSGPLSITQNGFTLPSDSRVVSATSQLGAPYNFNKDINSGSTLGIGWSPSTTRGGVRDSAWTSYIKPALAAYPKLDVVTNALVTRVLKTSTMNGLPVFRGVEFAKDSSCTSVKFLPDLLYTHPIDVATLYTLNATTEVIVSAGAANSPAILMHSGIGDASALGKIGISPIVDNAYVGKNVQDHALITNVYSVNDSFVTLDVIAENAAFNTQSLSQWQSTHTGPLTLNACSQLGWFRNPTKYTNVGTITDPSAGPTSGHFELIFTDAFVSFGGEAPPSPCVSRSCLHVFTVTNIHVAGRASTSPSSAMLCLPRRAARSRSPHRTPSKRRSLTPVCSPPSTIS
jgi:choline dehydrogenase-like flavoprotein